ncbi:MAG: hypothetical protein WCC10_18030 [Tumebacillaceae bacterium]
MTLDESRDHDKKVEVRGLHFVLDPFAASLLEEITVDYDDYEDSFTVTTQAGPLSSC